MKPKLTLAAQGQLVASERMPADKIVGEDEEETRLLRAMSDEAVQYIRSFSWRGAVLDSYFAGGAGKVFAVFFFHIRPGRAGFDPWIWIIVGDIPGAYLPISDCDSPAEVFRTYMAAMGRWVEFARKGEAGTPEQGVPPVNVPPTPEWAEDLHRRLETLRSVIGPFFGVRIEDRIN